VSRLAVGATVGVTEMVEQLHATIAAGSGPLAENAPAKVRGISGLVYRSVRGITRFVGSGLEVVFGGLQWISGGSPSSPGREAALAILNGVCGDFLEKSGNPLTIRMSFREAGLPLTLTSTALAAAFPAATGKILVLIHGLCRNDLQWSSHDAVADGEEFSIAGLARELGYSVVFLHYNSGLTIGGNGGRLAQLLETLTEQWPARVDELALVGHSMGGLVARSAVHQASEAGSDWPRRLRRMIFLGTPHLGAPLERGGHWFEQLLVHSPYAAPFARLAQIRSAGILDLRHGNLLDRTLRDDEQPEVLPLPEGIDAFTIAGTLAKDELDLSLLGDGLVPVASALGCHPDPARGLDFPPDHQWIAYDTGHLRLLTSAAVGEKLRVWLTAGKCDA
jgi:pimeloyl-ACP methyl ester carboxylesterase